MEPSENIWKCPPNDSGAQPHWSRETIRPVCSWTQSFYYTSYPAIHFPLFLCWLPPQKSSGTLSNPLYLCIAYTTWKSYVQHSKVFCGFYNVHLVLFCLFSGRCWYKLASAVFKPHPSNPQLSSLAAESHVCHVWLLTGIDIEWTLATN